MSSARVTVTANAFDGAISTVAANSDKTSNNNRRIMAPPSPGWTGASNSRLPFHAANLPLFLRTDQISGSEEPSQAARNRRAISPCERLRLRGQH